MHYYEEDKLTFLHYKVNDNPEYLHLHLMGYHYTPYFPATVNSLDQLEQNRSSVENSNEQLANDSHATPGIMTRYLVVEARPSHISPPWSLNNNDSTIFTHVQQLDEQPFGYKENLVYVLTSDIFLKTEVLEALLERKYIIEDELQSSERSVGEIYTAETTKDLMLRIFIKPHIDSKPRRPDLRQCVKKLKQILIKFEIRSIGIIRDFGMLSVTEWNIFIELCNKTFQGMELTIVFFKNNLPVPKVEDRYRIIKEYHESTIGGHKGIMKTYDKLAHEYYWRNMQSNVRHFVRGCPDCQTQKLVRVKTRLPMLIADTPSKPFRKISMDSVGPKEPTEAGNQYILTVQDNFSKYCILVPVKHASAEKVTRVLTNKVTSYFGSPSTLITDQGSHFMSKTLEELARTYKINKFCTTAYHLQLNEGIERMHYTLNEYLKMYLNEFGNWDELLLLAQHSYNAAVREGLGYSSHEEVFGYRARTPSSFPPREKLLTYNEYLAETTYSLAQLRTLAAMNLAQSKYKSKFYYDQNQNVRHFREVEMAYLIKKPKHGKTDQEYIGPCEALEINYDNHNAKIQKES